MKEQAHLLSHNNSYYNYANNHDRSFRWQGNIYIWD